MIQRWLSASEAGQPPPVLGRFNRLRDEPSLWGSAGNHGSAAGGSAARWLRPVFGVAGGQEAKSLADVAQALPIIVGWLRSYDR
jgi:hypothetical protein